MLLACYEKNKIISF